MNPLVLLRMAAIAAAVTAVVLLVAMTRQAERQSTLNDIREQTDEAISDADLAAMDLDDCNAARAAGKRVRFDFRAGRCVRAGPRR